MVNCEFSAQPPGIDLTLVIPKLKPVSGLYFCEMTSPMTDKCFWGGNQVYAEGNTQPPTPECRTCWPFNTTVVCGVGLLCPRRTHTHTTWLPSVPVAPWHNPGSVMLLLLKPASLRLLTSEEAERAATGPAAPGLSRGLNLPACREFVLMVTQSFVICSPGDKPRQGSLWRA